MRVAHMMSHLALNGVATSTRTLIELQVAAGHDVLLACRPGSWMAAQSFGPSVTVLHSDFDMRPERIRSLGYAIRDWGADLVHAHSSRANKMAMVFRLAAGTPVVMTAHARQFQLPWMFAHAVLAPSRPTADYYRNRFLVRPSRLHVVPHPFPVGPAPSVSDSERNARRAALGLSPGRLLLGSVGDLCARKNQTDMLRALAGLVARGIDAELLLIGPTHGRAELRDWDALTGDPALAGRVHLAGQRTDVRDLLPCLDVYLCTALVEEGPIATFEAMAAQVPVVSTDVGFTAALVPPERVVAVGDVDGMTAATAALLLDQHRRAAAARADRASVEQRLSPAAILPQIDRVYAAALDRARARPRLPVGAGMTPG